MVPVEYIRYIHGSYALGLQKRHRVTLETVLKVDW